MTPLNPQGTPSVVERLPMIAEGLLHECLITFSWAVTEAATLILTLQERIETLEAALKPFGTCHLACSQETADDESVSCELMHSEGYEDELTLGDFRKARSTLSPEGEG